MRSLAADPFEHIFCHAYHTLLIERHGYTILKNAIQESA
ncbi:hypothetical protein MELA_01880 [Candidatus Methylomirabilis lanthanidiphila]|uniref:Uncharacterized protein n=1 Tax=Candidatus Methylomirabilis lanthanidiphila TaxID=2211376 RepID=A0A564ZJJ5_9BACT|nr:hypothetical protein MELA_01880 [Candidatus Methylomirabilis lanthanidiphila]